MNMQDNNVYDKPAEGAAPGERFSHIENPKRTQEEMSLEFERLTAARACENLAGSFSYLFSANRMKEVSALFAHTDSDKITMPYGVYKGADAADRCFLQDMVDIDDPDPARHEELKGRMIIPDMCTGIVEVAGDGKTAKGLWNSPGLEAHSKDGKGQGWWNWSKFAMDFIRTEEGWKIWHFARYLYFSTEYLKSWAKSPAAALLR